MPHVDAGYHVVGMKAEDAPDIFGRQKTGHEPYDWSHGRRKTASHFFSPMLLRPPAGRHALSGAGTERPRQIAPIVSPAGWNTPMTEKGRAQARAVGEILKREVGMQPKLDFVSSPLARARLTMEIVLAVLGLPEDHSPPSRASRKLTWANGTF